MQQFCPVLQCMFECIAFPFIKHDDMLSLPTVHMRIHNYAANEDTFKFAFASFWMSCKQAVAQPLECWSIEEALDNAAGKTGVLLSNPDGKGTH